MPESSSEQEEELEEAPEEPILLKEHKSNPINKVRSEVKVDLLVTMQEEVKEAE